MTHVKSETAKRLATVEIDGTFEYLQPEYRQLYDDFDFATYFGKE